MEAREAKRRDRNEKMTDEKGEEERWEQMRERGCEYH